MKYTSLINDATARTFLFRRQAVKSLGLLGKQLIKIAFFRNAIHFFLKQNFKLLFFEYLILFLLTSAISSRVRPPLLLPPIEIIETDKKLFINTDVKISNLNRVPTSWGGGVLIQEEKEYQGFPITAYSLSEGAWILHRKIKLTASTIEIIGSDAMSGSLKGNVKVEDAENKVTLTAQKGFYDKMKETITLEGRPTLYYFNSENKLTKLTALKIIRYMKEDKIGLEGGVLLEDPDFTIISENAIYFEKASKLEMDKHPLIFGNNIFLTGNLATYNNNSKITTLTGETLIVRRSDEENDKEKKDIEISNEEKNLTFFIGNKLEIFSKFGSREQKVELTEKAKVIQKEYLFSGENISAYGLNYKNLNSKDEFIFFDKKSNIKIFGKLFEHTEEKRYTHITEDPKIEFMDKNGDITSTLTSVELERFIEKKEIVARGDVQILTDNGIIRGQFATYHENEKRILVEGNPTIERDRTKISCGIVIIYPEDNRILLSDGLGNIKEK
jgi:lipopolysaccharide export system protein LptA